MTKNGQSLGMRHYLLVVFLCLIYLLTAIFTASDYGLTWDQTLQDWYYGERNLRYLLSLNGTWIDNSRVVNFSMAGLHPNLAHVSTPWATLSFGNLLSCIGCYVFFVKLGLTDSITAHQIPNLLLMAGVLAAMFTFIRKHFGLTAALIGAFAIVFQPRWWADSHFNSKDFPYACIMAFAMLAARRGVLNRSAKWIISASILLGLAAATKLNAAMIPLILICWYPFTRSQTLLAGEGDIAHTGIIRHKGFFLALILIPLISISAFIAVWPILWPAPVKLLGNFLRHYMDVAMEGAPGFQWATFGIFILVQPPAILLFGGIGICAAIYWIIRKTHREESAFLLLWFVLPVLRVLLPRMHNFDGVRHFNEYSIPLGALTGIGAAQTFKWLVSKLGGIMSRRQRFASALAGVFIATPFLAWSVAMIRIHPYEIVYFNFLIGGAKGAEKFCDCGVATDYWGSSYRQGVNWLNANAEYNSTVVVPVAGHIVEAAQRMWMRRDLKLVLTSHMTNEPLKDLLDDVPSGPVYVMYVTRKSGYGELTRQVNNEGKLVFDIEVDGEPILKIMRFNKPGYLLENVLPSVPLYLRPYLLGDICTIREMDKNSGKFEM